MYTVIMYKKIYTCTKFVYIRIKKTKKETRNKI